MDNHRFPYRLHGAFQHEMHHAVCFVNETRLEFVTNYTLTDGADCVIIRTKHLIEIGGTVYSILGREFIEGDIERLAAFLKGQDSRGGYFSKAMNDLPAAPVTDPNTHNEKN